MIAAEDENVSDHLCFIKNIKSIITGCERELWVEENNGDKEELQLHRA